jgi:hypothetical protein
MPELTDLQHILIVTGMHRSGTSLVASLLESAGLDIGKRLLDPNYGNPCGYFENIDFLKLHEEILYSLGINEIGWTLESNISPPHYYIDLAYKLVEKNKSVITSWGWKDPRTTLFLPFWGTFCQKQSLY